jgi:hypothetical protein
MTHFIIEHQTERPDRIFVEVDRRFDVAIVRTEGGLELQVYPRTDGDLWIEPFTTFIVDEAEVAALEVGLYAPAT